MTEQKPAIVQNRCYARTGWDRAVRIFCHRQGIAYQGFSLLTANKRELSNPAVADIVTRTGATLPQLVFRFAMEIGISPLTGTCSMTHMQEDLACTGMKLGQDDIDFLEHGLTEG